MHTPADLFQYIEQQLQQSEHIDLSQQISLTTESNAQLIQSYAWCLVAYPEGLELIRTYPVLRNKLIQCNFDESPETGEHKGKTIGWWLAYWPEGSALLEFDPELHNKFITCNWDAKAESGQNKGQTIAWLMLSTKQNLDLLLSYELLREKLADCDFEAKAEVGREKGITLSFCLVFHEDGRTILKSSSRILQRFTACNLDARAEAGHFKGKTVAWLLAAWREGPELISSDKKLLLNFSSCNLNAQPQKGLYKGKTVAWWICLPEANELIENNPELIKAIALCELNTKPKDLLDKDKTVGSLLTKRENFKAVFRTLLMFNPTLDFTTLINIDEGIKQELNTMKSELKENIKKSILGSLGAVIASHDQISLDLAVYLFDLMLAVENPELHQLIPILNKNKDWRNELVKALEIDDIELKPDEQMHPDESPMKRLKTSLQDVSNLKLDTNSASESPQKKSKTLSFQTSTDDCSYIEKTTTRFGPTMG